MSITQVKNKASAKIYNRIINFSRRLLQAILRVPNRFCKWKIYFPYSIDLKHPVYNELKNHPPLKYCNKRDAKLLHLISGVSHSDKNEPHVLEIIDHAFSAIASLEQFPREPVEYFSRKKEILSIYQNAKLQKIVFFSEGQLALFRHYFPQQELLKKMEVINPTWSNNLFAKKVEHNSRLNFLFIASEFHTKGVPIVLEAWSQFATQGIDATLILVSHDIPKNVEENLPPKVKLIKQAPLDKKIKKDLFCASDVALACALTDGVSAVEAASYGKPVIMFRTQHSNDFLNMENGITINTPLNVYDVDKYGILWETKKQFNEIINTYRINGEFQKTIQQLIEAFEIYYFDRSFLKTHTKNSIKKYIKDYRIEVRNKKLIKIYNQCLKKIL
ncbi:MAG: glycosyltransferase [Rhodomicrobiaceae bacterium]